MPIGKVREKADGRILETARAVRAEGAEERLPEEWLWHGRRAKLVDGTTLSMPDTEANQAQYPQHVVQLSGIGFPDRENGRAVFPGDRHGSVGPLPWDRYAGKETGETALFREIINGIRLVPDELLLADRYYCSYFLLALLLSGLS